MRGKTILAILGMVFLMACGERNEQVESPVENSFQNEAHELVYEMTQKVGTMDDLKKLKDVEYTYTYTTPDGKEDISEERYLFEGELSYGKYIKHERTLPDLEGTLEQCYDGETFLLKHNGEIVNNEEPMKRVIFNRKTNFYWFTMLQKLLDPGVNYEHVGEENISGNTYDIVKITFQSPDNKPTDIYQLYINKKTKLVDQFLFTVADFNVMETPNLMQMEYEEVDGILIPSKRKYTKANWDGEVLDDSNWITVNWSDISFDNDFSAEDFR